MGGVGNAAYLGLVWLSEDVDEVREVLVELWVGWHWLWCSGELARARRSKWRRRWLLSDSGMRGWSEWSRVVAGVSAGVMWSSEARRGLSGQRNDDTQHNAVFES